MGGGYFVFLSQADSHQSISHGGRCDRCGLSWLVVDVMAWSDVTAAPTPPEATPENRHYFWALCFKSTKTHQTLLKFTFHSSSHWENYDSLRARRSFFFFPPQRLKRSRIMQNSFFYQKICVSVLSLKSSVMKKIHPFILLLAPLLTKHVLKQHLMEISTLRCHNGRRWVSDNPPRHILAPPSQSDSQPNMWKVQQNIRFGRRLKTSKSL